MTVRAESGHASSCLNWRFNIVLRLKRPACFRFCRRRLQTTIVNKTDQTIILREKYRDVWENNRFRMEKGTSVVVSWRPEQMYTRLGTFVETAMQTDLQRTVPMLFITDDTIANNEEIVINYSEEKQQYELAMAVRT